MPGTARTRTLTNQPPRTGYWDHGAPTGTVSYSEAVRDKKCEDVNGNLLGTNPLVITTHTISGGNIISINDDGFTANFPVPSVLLYASRNSGLAPTSTEVRNRMMSQTGPLTPNIYLPVSIFELKDLPHMVKWIGDTLLGLRPGKYRPRHNPAKRVAEATLAYQFGWAPLIQDITKMLNFAELVHKRQEILRKAHTVKGVRRKVKIRSDKSTTSGSKAVHSTWGLNLTSSWTNTTEMECWATIRWKVRDPSQIGKTPSFMGAFRTALGLNAGHIPIAIWKALPWSWLIDWFAGISDLLQASYNMIYYRAYDLCMMIRFTSERVSRASLVQSGMQFLGSTATLVELTRSPLSATITPTLKLPFLDAFKLSIVGSMSTLKLLRAMR